MNWILLRGLTRELAHWGDFPDALRSRFPQHRFHCLDLPGTGSRHHERSPATIAGICRRVQGYAEDIPGPVGLIGLSMGGMVALEWAQADPDRVASLVLINTSTGFSPPWRRMRPAAFGKVLGMMLRPDTAGRERRILQLTANAGVTASLEQQWLDIQRQRPVSMRTALAQCRAAVDYRPAPAVPGARALLLASTRDRIVHWHCSRALARRWNWPLRLHPSAGHDLTLDAPDWVLAQFESVA